MNSDITVVVDWKGGRYLYLFASPYDEEEDLMDVRMLWKAWYGDEELVLQFPERWKVHVAAIDDSPAMSDEAIESAFDNTIGSRPIAEIAKAKRTVAIAVDDLSRPTQAYRLLPPILRRLGQAGIGEEDIIIIAAVGAHRPMTRADFVKKIGEDAVSRVLTLSHNPYENLVCMGETRRGKVMVNRFFAEAELKIGVGCVCPHDLAGFSGGAKIVLPGVAGIETLEANHRPASVGEGDRTAGVGVVDGNETRKDMEEFARKIGLHLIVNVVVNSSRGVAGLFVGDVIQAHRAAVALAREAYATELPREPVDIVVLNAYPKDGELNQSASAFNILGSSGNHQVLKEGGTILIVTACSEGRGIHGLYERGMRLYTPLEENPKLKKWLSNYRTIVFSPNLSIHDLREWYPEETVLAKSWPEAMRELRCDHSTPSVAVFPCSTLQLPSRGG